MALVCALTLFSGGEPRQLRVRSNTRLPRRVEVARAAGTRRRWEVRCWIANAPQSARSSVDYLAFRLIVIFLILLGFRLRSPCTSTLASFSMTASGPHLPKMV